MKTDKEQFAQQLQAITHLHSKGTGGLHVALALTRRLDTLIRSVYESVELPSKQLVCVVALGGYGRKELCFGSDTDIMFLIQSEDQKAEATATIQILLHRLLDYGLDVGHSFRTVQECLEFSISDFESWNSLLESRYICGNKKIFSRLHAGITNTIKESDTAGYIQKLIASVEIRHKKYGNSTNLLEPNIKNSAGGLRDLHAAFWLLRATGYARFSSGEEKNETALSGFLKTNILQKQFSRSFLQKTRHALDFLLRSRNEMHRQANALHDTLEFSFQHQVAEALRYRSTKKQTNVEHFMHDYYIAVRSTAQLTRRVTRWANDHFLSSRSSLKKQPLDRTFSLSGNTIYLKPQSKLTNETALTAFLFSIEHTAEFSHQLEDALSRFTATCKPLSKEQETSLFRKLVTMPQGVSRAVHIMNDLGLLARWIPEWKDLVAFFQHNVYHYFTADEHTLMVLATAEGLATAQTTFGEVFRQLPRRDTLYFACLFHDIAKPQRIGDHEIIGVDIARAILKRLRYDDITEDVTFLVRNHLIMEQVAFRRNLSDPQTIIDFAANFGNSRQLDLLYLLTFADLNAVNKNVWTDWKGMLLYELYHRTRDILEGKLTSEQFEQIELTIHDWAKKELVSELTTSLSETEAYSHLDALDNPAYLSAFNAQEIAEHIRHIGRKETVSTIFNNKNDYTEITIIAHDAPFALSKFCGVLTANDANIFDAQIFTRNDGIIIDKFRVSDFITKNTLSESQIKKIQLELNDVLSGSIDISHLLHRHRMKWRRRTQHFNPNTRIDVEFEDHLHYSIIDVFAPDMMGFLYKITETMSTLGLNISFAKIATRVDGIVDSFYVTDQTGSKLDHEEQKLYVKKEILRTISTLTDSELVAN
ncbi:MAG: [protein-PII] uridylyltransferase [Ignavibacteriales bacterium]|nr:[protein-PII] uridylyltransferase [Ignavibacteriales bacterium]